MSRIFALMVAAIWALTSTAAYAGPLAAIVPVVIGVMKVTTVVKLALTVAATAAVSMLQKQKKQRPPGIMIEQTLTGGTNPRTLIMGTYATAGSLVTPPMSHGGTKKTPNLNLVKVIAIADMPVNGLSRVIINGEYVPLFSSGMSGQGRQYSFGGKYSGNGFVIFYDGNQTLANPYLTGNYASYVRPWGSNRIGKGVAYAIFSFEFDADLHKGEPDVRLEVHGMNLYDVRKDDTMGGVGPHRWGQPETYEFTTNPMVMVYNILRGIDMPDGSRYGGDAGPDDLPVSNWAAAMNACDVILYNEPTYRASLEFSVDEEPADVIEEILKASSTQIVENGGVYRVRVGAPSLPVMFITDDDWIITKDSELDPFPSIFSSKNTVRATFPHPEEVWQQHDAPAFTNPEYVARDKGNELVASLSFPACPYPVQVQRNMRAWLEDDQRLVRHSGTLSHRAYALEPLDTIAWTSKRNGYVDKWFEVGGTSTSVHNLTVSPALREVDPDDYDWTPSMELPDPVGDGGWDLPDAQAVEDFAVEPWSIKDDDSDARRPAIRATWDIDGAIDAMAVRIEVRLLATGEQVTSITVANVGDGQAVISEGILPSTSYEVRARYLVERPTDWTIWWSVTTGNIKLGEKDIDFDSALEKLGESVVIPQIMKPAKDTIIQSIRDAVFLERSNRTHNMVQSGIRASVTQEITERVTATDALATRIDAVEAGMITDGEVETIVNAAVTEEATARAAADAGLATRINTVEATMITDAEAQAIVDAAVTEEATARVSADDALATRITTVEASMITEDEMGAAISAAVDDEAVARVSADNALAGRLTTIEASYATKGDVDTAVGAAITDEAAVRAAADSALATRITTIEASYITDGEMSAAISAAVSVEASARASADDALAGQITTVSARLDNAGGSGVTVEQAFTATANSIDGLEGQYTLRINNQGKISGFGLASGAGGSEFAVLADRFIIADPGNASTVAYPFQVVDGTVYIRKALIKDGDIDTAKIGDAAITTAKIDDAAITTAKIGDAQVDTLRIAGNAVTLPISISTPSVHLLASNGQNRVLIVESDVIPVGIGSPDASVLISYYTSADVQGGIWNTGPEGACNVTMWIDRMDGSGYNVVATIRAGIGMIGGDLWFYIPVTLITALSGIESIKVRVEANLIPTPQQAEIRSMILQGGTLVIEGARR